ncbi:hypothetical protein [Brucella oryzae]|uniref:HEPN AbiU2-like domain-containing protein n=1 Tax=Brucella oryzae TaxID=335286 RepID=A0A2S7IZT7_9HYPH|nr:hypothetical protein [Brucella oryzae]PQA73517.1 hypothetical protein C3731_11275 [Brucella oryzae]
MEYKKINKDELKDNPLIDAMMRWGHIMLCVSNSDHILNKMETLRIEKSMDNIIHIDMLNLSFSITYGRMFSDAGNGFPKLDRNAIYKTERLRSIHDRIIELRNKRYAHQDDNDGIDFHLEVEYYKGVLKLKPQIKMIIFGNEFPAYRELINVLQAYTYEKIHKLTDRLSKQLGVPVEFPHGEPPEHHK